MAHASPTARALAQLAPGWAGLLCLIVGGIATAQTVTTTLDDGSVGSFRSVVERAGAGSTVQFNLGAASPTITLLVTPPNEAVTVAADLITIDGTRAPGLKLQGDAPNFYLRLDADAMVTDDLELRLIDVNQGIGAIELDGTLVFETNEDTTVEAQLLDINNDDGDAIPNQLGALLKTGDATLTLRSAMPTGGTTIEAGTLALENNSAAIHGDFSNGGILIFDVTNDTGSYAGAISDLDVDNAGSVEKIGISTVTFTGAHSYTGGTRIGAGTLIVDSKSTDAVGALATAGDVTIDPDGTLRFDLGEGAPGTYTGTWSSSGTLIVDGENENAVLDLTGADASLGGALQIRQGVLAVEAGDLSADVELLDVDDAILRLQSTGSSSFGRAITGAGRVEVDAGDAGTLTLSGNSSSFMGTTTLTRGSLIATANSLPGDAIVQSSTRLIFDQSSSTTYPGTIAGMGDVEKRGSGTLTFDGAHSFEGPMQVSAGTLAMTTNAVLIGDVIVESGATLRGAGSLTNSVAGSQTTVRGVLVPENMTVDRIHFEDGSRMEFSVFPFAVGEEPPANLKLEANGQVTTSGTPIIDVTVGSGDYTQGVEFTLIEGGAGANIQDGFTLVEDALEFLTVELSSLPAQSLTVTVSGDIDSGDIVAVAETPNQRSVAAALEEIVDDPAPDSSAQAVFEALLSVPTGAVPGVLDAVGGESLSAFTSAHLATAQRFERGLHRRVREHSWEAQQTLFRDSSAPAEPEAPTAVRPTLRLPTSFLASPPLLFEADSNPFQDGPSIAAWTDGWGLLGSADGDGNSHDVDQSLAGVSLGVDATLGEHGLVGVAVGYTYADLDVDGMDSSMDAHGIQTALYGGWSSPRGYASLAGRFAWARNESQRDISVGTTPGSVDADFDSFDYGLGLEVGANLVRLGPFVMQPFANADWTRVERDSFRESGGGMLSALALRVDDESIDSFRTGLGLRASLRAQIDEQTVWVPELRASWVHEFGDDERLVRGQFQDGTVPFRVSGVEAARDSFIAGVGWSVSLADRLRIHADYDAIVNEDALAHELGVTIRVRF